MNTQQIIIGQDYKAIQVKNTDKEIIRLQNEGIERITLDDMKGRLLEIGLTLDLNKNSYFHPYYSTLNPGRNCFEATTSPIDNKKISAYNTQSAWYWENLKGDFKSEKGRKLYELRNKYFCTIKVNRIEHILSF
jgi:hypothetical protein